jgi:hypothetical protein
VQGMCVEKCGPGVFERERENPRGRTRRVCSVLGPFFLGELEATASSSRLFHDGEGLAPQRERAPQRDCALSETLDQQVMLRYMVGGTGCVPRVGNGRPTRRWVQPKQRIPPWRGAVVRIAARSSSSFKSSLWAASRLRAGQEASFAMTSDRSKYVGLSYGFCVAAQVRQFPDRLGRRRPQRGPAAAVRWQ